MIPFSPKKRQLFNNRRKRLKLLNTITTGAFIFLIVSVFGLVASFAFFAKDLPSPSKLTDRNIQLSTKILDRNGEVLYDIFSNQDRTLVELGDIPQSLKDATVATEDKNFYKHKGFDLFGYGRVLKEVIFERSLTGGSTLTQQLVKNALLSSERTLPRKIKEFILAIEIEQKYSKDEILKIYLNEIPYGGTAYGAASAAKLYFNKDVKDLSLVESAILAGLPQQPTAYSPFGTNPKAYVERAKAVLRRMREDGYISVEKEEEARKDLENIKFAQGIRGIKAPHFSLYVKGLLVEKYGEKVVEQGGLKVKTSLDYNIQKMAEEVVAKELSKKENQALRVGNAAVIVQDPKTGEILAMVGSKDYFSDSTPEGCQEGRNCRFEPFTNLTLALRQPGSSIKPINYVSGFKKGYTAATMLLDEKIDFPAGEGQPTYSPVNYDGKFHGPVQVRYALGNSLNIPAVKMLGLVGVKEMINTAKDMGINTFTDESRYGLSLTLGGGEVKLNELTNAYSVFANGGLRVDPVSIIKVEDPKGKVLEEFKKKEGRRVLTAEHAWLINDILSDKNAKLDAFGSYAVENILSVRGRTVMVKTGTTDDKKDNWTVGGSPSYIVGVWTGNNDNTEMHPSLSSGITGAAPIWHAVIQNLLKDKSDEKFTKPDGIVQMEIDKISGMKPGPYSEKRFESFAKWQVPLREDDMHKKVLICRSSGKIAGASCASTGQYDEKIFLVMYDPYVQERCDPCPPKEYDTDYHNPTGDQSPVVSIVNPRDEENLDRTFDVKVDVVTPFTVTKVDFYFDDKLMTSSSTAPYVITYSLADSVKKGNHKISVKAYDSAGNVGSKEVQVKIK